jgi:hypothetical protein
MLDLLRRTLPMLVQLGDHIGNGPIDPARPDSLGTRCDLIGDIRGVLDQHAVSLRGDDLIGDPAPTAEQTIEKIVRIILDERDGRAGDPECHDGVLDAYENIVALLLPRVLDLHRAEDPHCSDACCLPDQDLADEIVKAGIAAERPGVLTLYELDERDEATGIVYFFCSELCREAYRAELGAEPHAPGLSTDAIAGTVCNQCEVSL